MAESTPEPEGENPLDQQRELMELLSQETRHKLVQFILGHPEHLASADELHYMVADKSKKTVDDQLDNLVDAGVLAEYRHPPNEDKRDLPWQFYGPTEYGIQVLGDFNYLKGVPFARAVYRKTRKTDKIKRHETAPRPSLPDAVQAALSVDDGGERRSQTEAGLPNED